VTDKPDVTPPTPGPARLWANGQRVGVDVTLRETPVGLMVEPADAPRLMMHVVLAPEGERPHPCDVSIVVLPGGVNPFALLGEACRMLATEDYHAQVPTGDDEAALLKMAERFELMARTESAYPTVRVPGAGD
jgi:hypothetical protein